MMFDENAYLDAYCRIKIECWYDYLESDISLKDASFPSLIYSALKNACSENNNENKTRFMLDGKALEKVFDRKKVLEEIINFLVDHENIEISYYIDYEEIDDVDKELRVLAENKDKYMGLVNDITIDDYIVLIFFGLKNLRYIKVYPDGTCKHARYAEWRNPVCEVKMRTLDKVLFDKIMAYAGKKAKSRKKRNELMCGEYPNRFDESYYKFGFRAFGQYANDYDYEDEKHYFEYKTKVKALDDLIRLVAPDTAEPILMGIPALPRMLKPKDVDMDEDELLGNPFPEFYEEDEEDIDLLFTSSPRPDGKDKCEKLREIRMKFAKDNDIDYEFKECTHEGMCPGTCPMCDKEAKDLARIAEKKGISFYLDE